MAKWEGGVFQAGPHRWGWKIGSGMDGIYALIYSEKMFKSEQEAIDGFGAACKLFKHRVKNKGIGGC